jgi:hypothetical protein
MWLGATIMIIATVGLIVWIVYAVRGEKNK